MKTTLSNYEHLLEVGEMIKMVCFMNKQKPKTPNLSRVYSGCGGG